MKNNQKKKKPKKKKTITVKTKYISIWAEEGGRQEKRND